MHVPSQVPRTSPALRSHRHPDSGRHGCADIVADLSFCRDGAQTVIILTGGCLFFGDEMPPEKLMGVLVAMAGIVWYSLLKIQETSGSRADSARLPLTGQLLGPGCTTATREDAVAAALSLW